MILITVGTQLPFDRLVEAMDNLAPKFSEVMFGQIGKSNYKPKNYNYSSTVEPADFANKVALATCIVAHAGTGSVLTARRFHKPIILFPRRFEFGEHRNDHQLATCRSLEGTDSIAIAYEVSDLYPSLCTILGQNRETFWRKVSTSKDLGGALADYIRSVSKNSS